MRLLPSFLSLLVLNLICLAFVTAASHANSNDDVGNFEIISSHSQPIDISSHSQPVDISSNTVSLNTQPVDVSSNIQPVDASSNTQQVCNTQRRKSVIARRFAVFTSDSLPETESPERVSHTFDVYEKSDDEASILTPKTNPLKSNKKGSKTKADSGALRMSTKLPPVEKPTGKENVKRIDSCESDSECEDVNELIAKIPGKFLVDGTSGKYKFDSDDEVESDPFTTSADLMTQRSLLYRLLAEIYFFFDAMDVDGFRDFLQTSPAALKHQSLKYHMIDNLVARSLKTENEDTWRVLGKFIDAIDGASVARSVGKFEKELFVVVETKATDVKKSRKYPEIITSKLGNFMINERKRLNPLKEYFDAKDYTGAKAIIESSASEVFVTIDDFLQLLELDCSSERYNFLTWAITFGHFNPHEKSGNQLMSPLMLAAKAPKWSNDIVKAILFKAPSQIAVTDAVGRKALYYAVNNGHLPKAQQKPLVKMLQLENPTYESLNEVLNKYRR